jgi:hypothetical protein
MVGSQQCHRAPPSAFLSPGDPLSPRVRCPHRIGGLLLLPPGKWLKFDINVALTRCRKLFFYQHLLPSFAQGIRQC